MSTITGEITIGMTILVSTPTHRTVLLAARDAPTMPPNNRCEDDDGRPFHQVSRFHAVAPMRAEPTMIRPTMPDCGSMMPLPTVSATLVPMKAPKRLKTAAITRATRGVSDRAETEVAIAIALAAS